MTLERILRHGAGLLIVTVAVLRVCASFAPRLVFDADPALDPSPLGGFGPAGSLVLDALVLAACAAGLYGEALAGRRIDWRLVLLALAPVPAVIAHGAGDFGDLWRGATWIAAAAGCCVLAHLGRDQAMRPILIALLAAVLVPVAVRGCSQSGLAILGLEFQGQEHAATVTQFEAHREAFLADRGWAPDSAAARIYERRLRSPDPRGWFPTSNLFASLMAFGAVLGGGLALHGAKRGRGWRAGFAAAAAVALVGLLLAGSKGGLGAALVGGGLVVAATRFRGWLSPRRVGLVVLGIVALCPVAVALRGSLLPESFLGDRSLLFRWHYLVGAGRVIGGEGWRGVGPDGFQRAYVQVRPSRSPEEVKSTHNAFGDWLATLGLLGAAWIGLAGLCLWRAGAALVAAPADARAPPVSERTPLLAAAAVTIGGLLPAVAAEYHTLSGLGEEALRMVGVLGYVIAAASLGALLGRAAVGFADRALAAAAIALVVHGQIEMTFFDPGSCLWALAVLGLAARVPETPRAAAPWLASGGTAAMLALAVWLGAVQAPRAFAAQRFALEAARAVAEGTEREHDPAAGRWAAAELLEVAWEQLPQDVRPLEEAARQWLLAAALAPPTERRPPIDRALERAERAVALGGRPGALALAADAWRFKAEHTADPADWEAAIGHAQALTRIDPHGIGAWVRLGDLLWEAGQRHEAQDAYRRALANSDNFALDPLKQLGEGERRRLEERSPAP